MAVILPSRSGMKATMRVFFAAILAFALLLLPAAGGSARAEPTMDCHGAAHHPVDKAKACAEHCMTLVTVAQPTPALQPSIANTVRAPQTITVDLRGPQAGVAPETPPPRR